VDTGVRPTLLPTVEVRLSLFEALEAQSLERRLLRVANACLDLALRESNRLQPIRVMRDRLFA